MTCSSRRQAETGRQEATETPPDNVRKPTLTAAWRAPEMCQDRVCYGDPLVKLCTMSAIAVFDS